MEYVPKRRSLMIVSDRLDPAKCGGAVKQEVCRLRPLSFVKSMFARRVMPVSLREERPEPR